MTRPGGPAFTGFLVVLALIAAVAVAAQAELPVTDGFIVHLDATTLELADNAAVETWPNLVAEFGDFSQPTALNRPVYQTTTWGDKPTVKFTSQPRTGQNRFLAEEAAPNNHIAKAITDESTIFLVGRTRVQGANPAILNSVNYPDHANNRFVVTLGLNDTVYFDHGDSDVTAGHGRVGYDFGSMGTDFYLWGFRADPNLREIRQDAVSLVTKSGPNLPSYNPAAAPNSRLLISGDGAGEAWHGWDGDLAELLI